MPTLFAISSIFSLPRALSCTPITTRPFDLRSLIIFTFSGSAARHGPHHVAQKSITITLPLSVSKMSPFFLSGSMSAGSPSQPMTSSLGGVLPVISRCAGPALPSRQNHDSGNSPSARAVLATAGAAGAAWIGRCERVNEDRTVRAAAIMETMAGA